MEGELKQIYKSKHLFIIKVLAYNWTYILIGLHVTIIIKVIANREKVYL